MPLLRTNRLLALVVAAAFAAAGCRVNRIWSGIELQPDGTLKLASEEPRCGCLSVVNAMEADVRLRAMQRNQLLGETVLKSGDRQRFRFDWGGAGEEDAYQVSVTTMDGGELSVDDALEVEDRPRWVECEAASCEFGDLHMEAVGRDY